MGYWWEHRALTVRSCRTWVQVRVIPLYAHLVACHIFSQQDGKGPCCMGGIIACCTLPANFQTWLSRNVLDYFWFLKTMAYAAARMTRSRDYCKASILHKSPGANRFTVGSLGARGSRPEVGWGNMSWQATNRVFNLPQHSASSNIILDFHEK